MVTDESQHAKITPKYRTECGLPCGVMFMLAPYSDILFMREIRDSPWLLTMINAIHTAAIGQKQ